MDFDEIIQGLQDGTLSDEDALNELQAQGYSQAGAQSIIDEVQSQSEPGEATGSGLSVAQLGNQFNQRRSTEEQFRAALKAKVNNDGNRIYTDADVDEFVARYQPEQPRFEQPEGPIGPVQTEPNFPGLAAGAQFNAPSRPLQLGVQDLAGLSEEEIANAVKDERLDPRVGLTALMEVYGRTNAQAENILSDVGAPLPEGLGPEGQLPLTSGGTLPTTLTPADKAKAPYDLSTARAFVENGIWTPQQYEEYIRTIEPDPNLQALALANMPQSAQQRLATAIQPTYSSARVPSGPLTFGGQTQGSSYSGLATQLGAMGGANPGVSAGTAGAANPRINYAGTLAAQLARGQAQTQAHLGGIVAGNQRRLVENQQRQAAIQGLKPQLRVARVGGPNEYWIVHPSGVRLLGPYLSQGVAQAVLEGQPLGNMENLYNKLQSGIEQTQRSNLPSRPPTGFQFGGDEERRNRVANLYSITNSR